MTEQNLRSSLLGKIAAYTEILAKDPQSTIFVSLGETYRKLGMLDDARQVIENGLESHTDFSPAHTVQARILCQQGDYQASSAAFERALDLDQESLAALVGYARLNILQGNEVKAREILLTARALSPADPVINKLLLSLPAEQEPVEEPVEEDENQAAIQTPLASATLAELYLKQGLENQALEIYRQLSIKDPNNLVLRRQIRDLEERLDDTDVVGDIVTPAEDQQEQPEFEKESEIDTDGIAEHLQLADVETSDPVESLVTLQSGTTTDDESRVLNTLNRWLASIQQRRSDV